MLEAFNRAESTTVSMYCIYVMYVRTSYDTLRTLRCT
jgi:hypothetical protein